MDREAGRISGSRIAGSDSSEDAFGHNRRDERTGEADTRGVKRDICGRSDNRASVPHRADGSGDHEKKKKAGEAECFWRLDGWVDFDQSGDDSRALFGRIRSFPADLTSSQFPSERQRRPATLQKMPSPARKKGPPAGLRIRVDANASSSSLLPTAGSQPSLIPDNSPATPSAAPSSAETPSSPAVDVAVAQPSDIPRPKRTQGRNMKQLSLQLPACAIAPQSDLDDSDAERRKTLAVPPTPALQSFGQLRTRSSSIASVTSVASLHVGPTAYATRAKEDGTGAPYADGPIQILPGIWLGQEENARNWPDLAARGIRWVLNVAKEVAPCADSAGDAKPVDRLRIRPSASTPNLAQPHSAFLSRRKPGPAPESQPEQPPQPRAVPFTPPTGGPALLYIHLPWSHGQSDLVKVGFPTAMSFVDHAQRKGQGVLIHCQCGVSRSATLMIALVMRASMPREGAGVPEDLTSIQGGMHNAYAYVKDKSKWIGPNMSLIYQLLEYERSIAPNKGSPSVTSDGTEASEEEEWSRKRLAMEREEAEAEAAAEDRTREAKDLDRAMEERMAAKRAGPPPPLLLNPPTAWRNRFPSRKRAGSVHSTFTTNSSIISEDPLEDDEDSEDGDANITIVPHTKIDLVLGGETSPSARTNTDDESPSKFVGHFADAPKGRMKHKRSASLAISANSLPLPPPPSAPAHKMSFAAVRLGAPLLRRPGSRATAPPSAPAAKSGFSFPPPGSRVSSVKRPTPLPTVPSSPVAVPTLATPKTTRARPAPLRLPATPPSHIAIVPSSSAPQQTLFVFPPDRTHTLCTPATLTLTMMTPGVDKQMTGVTPTPRNGSFGATRKPCSKRMSWLTMGVTPPTPTTACSRVDAKGWVGFSAAAPAGAGDATAHR
ncbi:hypothetical protein CTheo_2254 [Ceratobasidium theobromae]|uniref:protein-tyrosine-phosphatase n=1 Tax=Ceratobasidium theobromae TaxID=1582974 RepID=A0A5N5QRJ1_9AGAM|nr:hypothetical protein CTheo_2254 [Ceratobasidium theobromae]